ncbi:hypothetical protein FBQ97_19655, partial [Acidobacteria bacterium ACD]|nr:hypothetical protein [Acidobacteria bacterium ACD]
MGAPPAGALRRHAPPPSRPALPRAPQAGRGRAEGGRASRRSRPSGGGGRGSRVTREEVSALLDALERGEVRAAVRGEDGVWRANAEVKEGILEAFRLGVDVESGAGALSFRDRDTLPPRRE